MNIARLSYQGDVADRNLRQMQIMLSGMNDQERIKLMKDDNFRQWAALQLQGSQLAQQAKQFEARLGLDTDVYNLNKSIADRNAEDKKLEYGLQVSREQRADTLAEAQRRHTDAQTEIARLQAESLTDDKAAVTNARKIKSIQDQVETEKKLIELRDYDTLNYRNALYKAADKNFIPTDDYARQLDALSARAGDPRRHHVIIQGTGQDRTYDVISGKTWQEVDQALQGLGMGKSDRRQKLIDLGWLK